MRHRLTVTLIIALLSIVGPATLPGQSSQMLANSPGGSDNRVVVGCLTAAGEGFVLQSVAVGQRTGGSTSPKASTPVAGPGNAAIGPKDTAGSNSAKASTPIVAGSTVLIEGRRTSGSTTPKGSTPIRGAAPLTYWLRADLARLAPLENQWLEVRGASVPSVSDDAQILRVADVRVLASRCGQ